jgi:PucR C-terminal helix-turn-helix domain
MKANVAERNPGQSRSSPQALADLAGRLRGRSSEIEHTVLSRVYAVSDPADVGDPVYMTGLRTAVSVAVSFGVGILEKGSERADPVPSELLTQARNAARRGVPLDTVLRRYFAGHTLLGDFIFQEADAMEMSSPCLQEALRIEAAILDQLVGAVAAEYRSEIEIRSRSRHRRCAERVEKLLAGDLLEARNLNYDLDGWHVGAIVVGAGGADAMRDFAGTIDRRLLLVRQGEGTLWAWFGGLRPFGPDEMDCLEAPSGVRVAVGEPGRALPGWRLTHRQAAAALPVALRGPEPRVRYAEVALLAAMLQDEVLAASLRELYLAPLSVERDGGKTFRETLRAYLGSERNVSSAAALLGVSRQTVNNRLHTVEERLGRPLGACAAEIESILRLEELEGMPASSTHVGRPALHLSI